MLQITDLEILYKVIENAQAFRILTVLDVHQRANFGSLTQRSSRRTSASTHASPEETESADLKCYMVVPNTDLELLLPNNVLLGPVRVVFPAHTTQVSCGLHASK